MMIRAAEKYKEFIDSLFELNSELIGLSELFDCKVSLWSKNGPYPPSKVQHYREDMPLDDQFKEASPLAD